MNYYPLAVGNEWHYRLKDGTTYSNKVTGGDPNAFTMYNSAAGSSSVVKTDANGMVTDALEAGNFQPWIKNNAVPGDNWEIKFKANGLDCLLIMTVKETGISKEVEGKMYDNILFIEAENRIIMNGTVMPLNFFTQYYYADSIGLVLTTSSAGDSHALVNYTLH